MTHPLTDEMCYELSVYPLEELGDEYADGTMTDMRAAYDKGAADMLKQVIKWINEAIFEQSTCFGIESLPEELAKAMRPQEDS